MNSDHGGHRDRWVIEAIEQARIILAHLENGGEDDDFLRPHALSLFQMIDSGPVVSTGRRYLI